MEKDYIELKGKEINNSSFLLKLPKELKLKAKIKALQNETNVSELLREFLVSYVEESKRAKKKIKKKIEH